MDHRIKGRVDGSDVIQEAFVEAASRFESFQENQTCSPYVWLRFLTLQKLAQFHRHHIKVKARSVRKEVAAPINYSPASSVILANNFIGNGTTPLEKALKNEQRADIVSVIESLAESDREVLAMRHFEQLTNAETAEALGIPPNTAYKRYIRALQHVRAAIKNPPMSSSNS